MTMIQFNRKYCRLEMKYAIKVQNQKLDKTNRNNQCLIPMLLLSQIIKK